MEVVDKLLLLHYGQRPQPGLWEASHIRQDRRDSRRQQGAEGDHGEQEGEPRHPGRQDRGRGDTLSKNQVMIKNWAENG